MLFDWLLRRGLYFDKDDAGSGGSPDDSTEDKAEKKDKSDESEAGDEKDKTKAKDEKTYSKAEVEALVIERLERERKKSEAEAEKARKKAEADALEKNQEWQKLAETRQEKITELEKQAAELTPFKDQAEKYKAALDAQLAKVKEKLPKHILPLIEKLDPVDAMAYITENAEALGAKPETYSETPEGKEKKVSDDDTKKSKEASTTIITRTF